MKARIITTAIAASRRVLLLIAIHPFLGELRKRWSQPYKPWQSNYEGKERGGASPKWVIFEAFLTTLREHLPSPHPGEYAGWFAGQNALVGVDHALRLHEHALATAMDPGRRKRWNRTATRPQIRSQSSPPPAAAWEPLALENSRDGA